MHSVKNTARMEVDAAKQFFREGVARQSTRKMDGGRVDRQMSDMVIQDLFIT